MTDLVTYRIPAVNFPRLQEEIEKLNKRAARLNTEPVKLTILETVTEKKRNEVVGFDYQETFHVCTVEGEAPKLKGWSLIAAIEPMPNSENLVREVPGERCPHRFRTTDMHCDHCGSVRKRNAIFVLKHENGDYKQVGRQCIADFLGHEQPESLLNRAEYMFDFSTMARDAQEEGWGMGGGVPYIVPVTAFVITAAVVVRKLGWVPRSKAGDFQRATADIVWDICTRPSDRYVRELIRENDLFANEKDEERAVAAIEWAKSLDPVFESSNYLHDLGVCCRQAYVDHRSMGFVASVLQAHGRVLAEAEEAKHPQFVSKHVGEAKQRLKMTVVVMMAKPYVHGIYDKTLVKLRDNDGNIFIWRASGSPDWLEVGKTFEVKATVKSHGSFNGELQTEVQRVEPVETPA